MMIANRQNDRPPARSPRLANSFAVENVTRLLDDQKWRATMATYLIQSAHAEIIVVAQASRVIERHLCIIDQKILSR